MTHLMSREDILENIKRAEMCEEATIPGELLREILRLALIGIEAEEKMVQQ